MTVSFRLVLSRYVFDETVTTLLFQSERHEVAVAAGRAILETEILRMVRVEAPVFEDAWSLFPKRPDKRWSFTDCTSFVLMDHLDLRSALANDRNFSEAGFALRPQTRRGLQAFGAASPHSRSSSPPARASPSFR